MLIALCGRKRSGKDTAALALADTLGFKRYAFADKLKELTAHFLGLPVEEVARDDFKARKLWHEQRGLHLTAGRDVLQRLGAAARKTFGEDFWAERLLADLGSGCEESGANASVEARVQLVKTTSTLINAPPETRVVITDVRYWSELHAISSRGGLIIRLNRADRVHRHEFSPAVYEDRKPPDACGYLLPDGGACDLPATSHPSHWSSDRHASETELPDESESACYDKVIEAASADDAAAAVLAFVRERGAQ